MKRFILCLILMLGFLTCEAEKAEACPYSTACTSKVMVPHCGYRYGTPAFTHDYRAANGNIFTCGVTNEQSSHTFTCGGCGTTYGSSYNEVRTCIERHSACGGTRTYLCSR